MHDAYRPAVAIDMTTAVVDEKGGELAAAVPFFTIATTASSSRAFWDMFSG